MKIVFTKHVSEKLVLLKRLGWEITEAQILETVENPKWSGKSKHGQATAMSLVADTHILRVIFNEENGTIKVVTIHVARRGRYESTL